MAISQRWRECGGVRVMVCGAICAPTAGARAARRRSRTRGRRGSGQGTEAADRRRGSAPAAARSRCGTIAAEMRPRCGRRAHLLGGRSCPHGAYQRGLVQTERHRKASAVFLAIDSGGDGGGRGGKLQVGRVEAELLCAGREGGHGRLAPAYSSSISADAAPHRARTAASPPSTPPPTIGHPAQSARTRSAPQAARSFPTVATRRAAAPSPRADRRRRSRRGAASPCLRPE